MYYLLAAFLFKMILPFFIKPTLKLIKMSIMSMTGKILFITWNNTVRDGPWLKQFTITVNTKSISIKNMTNTYHAMSWFETGKHNLRLFNFYIMVILLFELWEVGLI